MKEDVDLMEKFIRISELIARYHHRRRREHGPGGDPHRGQGRLMSLLKLRPETTQKELSYLLDIRPQSLGELLAKLERQGFIERNQSEVDRRVVNVRLTDEGAKAAESVGTADRFFTGFSDDEQSTLSAYLDRVIGELEQNLAAEPEGMDEDDPRPHGPHPHGCRPHGPRHEGPPHHDGPPHRHGRCHEGPRDPRPGCEGRMRHGHGRPPAPHERGWECEGGARHEPRGMRCHEHEEPGRARDDDE